MAEVDSLEANANSPAGVSDEAGLVRKTVSSTAWTYFSYVLSKGVNLLTTVVLARLLTQAQFGIVGFALTAMSFLDAVRDIGLELALIHRRDNVEEAADTTFWLSISSNFIVWLLTCAVSPLVAAFFNEPLVTIILPVVSFSFVISSFGTTHDALLKRDMRFSRRLIPSLGESFLKSVISVGLAVTGAGVWALVLGQVAGRFAFTVLAWVVMPWRPRRRFSWSLAKSQFRYGYKTAIDSFLSALQANIDYVFIGRFLGDASLGLYTIAYRMPEIVIINLCIVIAQVLFPAYASLQNDMDQLRRGMLAALRYIALVTVPVGVGMALTATLFTTTIFGAEWTEAGPIMAALSIYGALLAISWNIGDVYKAIGRPDILWKTTLVEFMLLAPTLFVLAQHSAFAVSLGHVSVAAIVSLMRLYIGARILAVPMQQALAQFAPAVISSVFMGVFVWLSLQATAQWPGLLSLAAAALVGALTYVAALWWVERDLVMSVLGLVRRFVGRKAIAAAD